MQTRLLAAALLAGSMLTACSPGASYPTFAENDYRIQGRAADASGALNPITIYRDGPKMRVETVIEGKPAAIVFDEATNAALVVDSTARTVVAADTTSAPEPMEAPWQALGADNAERVGECSVAGETGNEWRPKSEPNGNIACITNDGIVLKVREGERVIFEATSLTRGDQAASLFGVPPGYQTVDPTAVISQVGETMDQLDSVTPEGGTTTAPAQLQPKQ